MCKAKRKYICTYIYIYKLSTTSCTSCVLNYCCNLFSSVELLLCFFDNHLNNYEPDSYQYFRYAHQPVNSHNQGDITCRKAHCCQHDHHGYQSSIRDSGCSDACYCCCNTAKVALIKLLLSLLVLNNKT